MIQLCPRSESTSGLFRWRGRLVLECFCLSFHVHLNGMTLHLLFHRHYPYEKWYGNGSFHSSIRPKI
jgi:hypothetical protein